MITGKGNYDKIYKELFILVYGDKTESLVKLWTDVTKKIYPKIITELDKILIKDYGLNDDDFIIMWNVIKNDKALLPNFISNISQFDINKFGKRIFRYPISYPRQ